MQSKGGPESASLSGALVAALLILAAGFAVSSVAYRMNSYGYALMLGSPLVLGMALGYWLRIGNVAVGASALLVLFVLVSTAVTLDAIGLFCGLVAGLALVLPLVFGALLGSALQRILSRRKSGGQRNIPVILLLLSPSVGILVEASYFNSSEAETIETSRILAVPADEAWRHLMFFEEVTNQPPFLTRIGLPRPLYTQGEVRGVGDVKACLYDSGRLVKRITRYNAYRLLEFQVIEQNGIEDRSIRLLSGSFRFEALDGARSRVSLTTVYEPLLSARLIWRPFERAVAASLHEHVLEGIETAALSPQVVVP